MLITNFKVNPQDRLPIYVQICNFIKEQINTGQLAPEAKLPSVRKLAQALGISRTTSETVYGQLVAEGYLVNRPKRGYYAADLLRPTKPAMSLEPLTPKAAAPYDFANNYVDAATFPAALWRRQLNNVLKDRQALTTYGSPQGEAALRQALAKYSNETRGVICTPEQIVIGAGVQSLLEVLAAVLEDIGAKPLSPSAAASKGSAAPKATLPAGPLAIGLEEPGFPQAEEVFTRHGWQVEHFTCEKLHPRLPKLLYISPSNPYKGRSLTPQQRLELLHWCNQYRAYILEDDYNGEFRYFNRPFSSLQGMSDGKHIIYLGSFARLLLPSLRISYMVLPPQLVATYQGLAPHYNQTSSTIEQLALAGFINEGSLRRHVKKLRRLYSEKNTLLRRYLSKYLKNRVEILAYESGLHIRIKVKAQASATALAAKALRLGVKVLPLAGTREVLLSFAGIQENQIEPAVRLLQQAWFKE